MVLQLSYQVSNRTVLGQPPQPYSEALRTVLGQRDSPWKSFEAVALLVGFPSGNPPKIGTFTAWNRTRNRTQTPPDYKEIKLLLSAGNEWSRSSRVTYRHRSPQSSMELYDPWISGPLRVS